MTQPNITIPHPDNAGNPKQALHSFADALATLTEAERQAHSGLIATVKQIREGKRVEVKHRWASGREELTRFIVGKSTGFIPCHLEIKTRRSHGGGAVCLGEILSVHVVS